MTTTTRIAAPSACICSVDAVTDPQTPPVTPSVAPPATAPSAPRFLDPFAGDPASGEWRRVSSRYLWVDLLGGLLGTVIFTAISSIPFWLSGVVWLLVIPAVVLVTGLIIAAFVPRRVRAIGYQLRADDFLVRRGIMFQRFAAVPYGRMQLVDINRGPLDRVLGLAELKLVTAASASNVAVPGLPMADAEALRDRLVELAESRRAGL
jgi:membrane protein YdbS with pleckstrin-like domain